MTFVDLWGWFNALRRRADQQGDAERIRLFKLYERAREIRETDPKTALSFYTEARELAERLREPCLMLFFDYWRSEIYLYYLHDVVSGLDQSVKNSVEAQKPMYRLCPVLGRVYLTLATAQYMTDPLGNAEQIKQTLDYLERKVALDQDTWRRIEDERAALAYTQNRLEDSERLTLSYISRCEGNHFRLRSGYKRLCQLNYERRKFDKALEYAQLGEEVARKANVLSDSVAFLAWQALLNEKLGLHAEAS